MLIIQYFITITVEKTEYNIYYNILTESIRTDIEYKNIVNLLHYTVIL